MSIPPEAKTSYTVGFLRVTVVIGVSVVISLSGLVGCASGEKPSNPKAKFDPGEAPQVFGQRVSGAKAAKAPEPAAAEKTEPATASAKVSSVAPPEPVEHGSPEKVSGAVGSAPGVDGQWSIVLAAFRGEGHRATALAGLARVQALPGLEGAFVTTRGEASFIGYGGYADPSDGAAQADLKRVRGTQAGAEKPFADAFLAPPVEGPAVGSRPEYNLVRAREQYGKAQLVTLQVAVYSRLDVQKLSAEDLAAIRQSAEQAAAQLRREGEQAYYFHGQRQSMVTIGVFPEEDVTQKRSPAAAALKKRHPYNLLNGAGYRTGSGPAPRSSEFVRVP